MFPSKRILKFFGYPVLILFAHFVHQKLKISTLQRLAPGNGKDFQPPGHGRFPNEPLGLFPGNERREGRACLAKESSLRPLSLQKAKPETTKSKTRIAK
jgi:hypothetical protein